MNKDGEQILATLRGVRAFFEDVSLLLRTAEVGMQKAGWEPVEGKNEAVWEYSYSIHGPRQWMPHYAFRFFANDQRPTILAFVSVTFDVRDDEQEPLVSAGYLEFAEKPIWKNLDYWYPHIHLFQKPRVDDGTFLGYRRDEGAPKVAFTRATTMALPLVQITSSELLDTKVIRPLLQELG